MHPRPSSGEAEPERTQGSGSQFPEPPSALGPLAQGEEGPQHPFPGRNEDKARSGRTASVFQQEWPPSWDAHATICCRQARHPVCVQPPLHSTRSPGASWEGGQTASLQPKHRLLPGASWQGGLPGRRVRELDLQVTVSTCSPPSPRSRHTTDVQAAPGVFSQLGCT